MEKRDERAVAEREKQHPGLTAPALIANYRRMIEELDPPTAN